MKKLDKFILYSFIGPFFITFLVAVFILLLVYMLKYFDDFIGKDLGFMVFAKLMGYFSINQVPMALPLAVLISALMTYGQLGEHFELTAIKGSGISLLRVILPSFVFVVLLAIGDFFLGDRIVPSANLNAYSLLYDIKHTKPALDLREGQFYDGIPGYSILVDKKYPDGVTMENVIVYDHTSGEGNTKITVADSCRMYTFMNGRYLKMELYRGNYYIEDENQDASQAHEGQFVYTNFLSMDLVFSLASFDLNATDKSLFANNRYMKGIQSLTRSIDSMRVYMNDLTYESYTLIGSAYDYHLGGYLRPPESMIQSKQKHDSLQRTKDLKARKQAEQYRIDTVISVLREEIPRLRIPHSEVYSEAPYYPPHYHAPHDYDPDLEGENFQAIRQYQARKSEEKRKAKAFWLADDSLLQVVKAQVDSVCQITSAEALSSAVNKARNLKSSLDYTLTSTKDVKATIDAHVVEKYKKYAQAFSCIVMFLIGAPLGAIIKRGGLGVPVLVSVFFFILFYIFTSVGDKWAKTGFLDGLYAAWMANAVLLPFGLFFLKQARKDARLFDTDFYAVWIEKTKSLLKKRMRPGR